jgi:hypothetical protein
MKRTNQAIRESFSKQLSKLGKKLEESKQDTINKFVRETVYEVLEMRVDRYAWETPFYKEPILMDAREILNQLIEEELNKEDKKE